MILKFDTLEDYMTFADTATKDGVLLGLRSGLEIEVPDGYNPKGKTSAQLDAEMQAPAPEPEPEPEAIEMEPAAPPESEVSDAPSHSARRSEWVDHAESLGIDTTDLTKAEIIEKVEGA